MKQYEGIHLYEASIITTILAYGILLYFSLNFYLNYRRISATDSTKKLMENIMRTRRAVKRYIWWVLSLNAVYMMVVSVATLIYDERMISIFEKASSQDKTTLLWAMFIGIMLFVTIMLTVVFWLFYQLLYGLLLRRLTKNYKELKKMELQ
jgi:magnesium-transporting ATPase (P-type)